jgi:tetratricopeptide (TPR) repeat protein
VWSLGVLLYELTTGTLPFTGRTPFETSSAILNEPLRAMPRAVPLAVRLVIERCLVKDPDARYQRAEEVRHALDAIRRRHAWPLVGRLLVAARRRTLYATAAAAVLVLLAASVGPGAWRRLAGAPNARITTLALVPLENATHDPAFDYYAAGLTEGLIAQLGEATEARVIATTSNTDSLGADAVVSGRLRRAGDRVAVDARLVERAGGRVLWSDTFERTADQTLALQADVVRALAGAVRLAVRPGAADRLAMVRAVSPEAYEAYLKGRYEWNRRTQASLQRALAHYKDAIALDPTYAPAYAALADCYNQFGTVLVGTGSPRQYRPLAAAAAIHALQIDPYSAEAHAALGYTQHYDLRWADAERELRRAIALNPSYAMAHVWYANLLMSRGRMDEALAEVQLARGLDPFSLIVNANVGWVLSYAGRPEEAIGHLQWTLALDSTYVQARVRLVGALLAAGRYVDGHHEAERLVRLTGRSPAMVAGLARADVKLGRLAAARALLEELVNRGRTSYVPPASIAQVFAELGDRDKAVAWMTRAFEERSNAIAYLAVDPGNAMMRDDPRFQALLARAGLP